ncbi:DUF6319 family protein [Antrihabitans cavernicola]|uniref:Translation initiation factor n=1 Tax=Antrihabitans cavernicola TaxID=2495913 RepID=A0A5A7S826_9NOCA|nr:DUF6319 family protein [Spelaeibacter cavernicola]KAA0019432.1 translation initiation factor [Spelaeibacter cavernicola]
MPPRAGTATDSGLSSEHLVTLSQAIAEGKRATVYLREATPSLNLPPGASARVVRVEGNTVTLRPRGVDDELPFEAEELRITRAEAKPAVAQKRAPRVAKAAPPVAAIPVAVAAAISEPAPPKAPTRAPKRVQDGISVTIQAGVDDDWTVAVAYGGKPRGKPASVSADAVGRAVAELGDPTAQQAVDAVLLAARQTAAKRVAELSKQLDAARNALAALGAPES